MPSFTIDGREISFESGKSIIEVALENDIEVPHFCWHPSLSVSGNCRMCFVEVEGSPKLSIACNTPASEGQVVHTRSEKAEKGREAIMEFLLINHPLDCPICDEAGQCKLQDYAFQHGRGESRFEEMKVRKEKRVQLGPQVLFDGERCISCSRCIRFADEVADQPVLSFVNRGDHVSIETFPGTEFDSPYSMNVIDICPVGALTSVDFRFKARVWDMSFNESICPGCARGCNIDVGVRDNEVLRVEPRTNMKVNEFWMCDAGRLETYPQVNLERYDGPQIRAGEKVIGVSWEEALSEASSRLRGIKQSEIWFIASGNATTEENYALNRFAREVLGTQHISAFSSLDSAFADNKLRVADRSPNSAGLKLLKIDTPDSTDHLIEAIESGRISVLYVLDQDLPVSDRFEEALEKLDTLIVHASNHTPLAERADVVFANATWAENEGTFVNVEDLVQHFEPAIATRENQSRMGMKQSRLDKFGAYNDRWTRGTKRDVKPAWQVLSSLARLLGTTWKYAWAEDLFEEMAGSIGDLKGMSYEQLDTFRGVKLGQGERPAPYPKEYEPHFYRPQLLDGEHEPTDEIIGTPTD